MPNAFNYFAFISESPEGLRRGREFRVEIEVGFKKHGGLNVCMLM